MTDKSYVLLRTVFKYGISRKRYAVFFVCGHKCSACQEKQMDFRGQKIRLPCVKGALVLSGHFFGCFDNMQFNSYKAVLLESHCNLSFASLYGSQTSSVCSCDKTSSSVHSKPNEYSGMTYKSSDQP